VAIILLMKILFLAPDEPVKHQATVNVLSQPKHDKYDIYDSTVNFDMPCAVKFSKLSTNVES